MNEIEVAIAKIESLEVLAQNDRTVLSETEKAAIVIKNAFVDLEVLTMNMLMDNLEMAANITRFDD